MSEEINLENRATTKGFAILTIAALLSKVMSLLYTPFLRVILGDYGVGIYSSSYQIYVFIYMIATAGIPIALSKNISQLISVGNPKDGVKIFKMARAILCVMAFFLSIGMFIFAEQLCGFIKTPKAIIAVRALSPTIFITAILSTYRGYFQGRNNMTPTAISQVVEQVVNIVFSLVCAFLLLKLGTEWGVAGATVGTTLGAFVATIVIMRSYRKQRVIRVPKTETKIRRLSNRELLKRLFNTAFPITVCVALQNLGLILDPRIVKSGLELHFSAVDVEIYWGWLYQYTTLINIPVAIAMSLATAILPAISGLTALGDRKNLRNKINYSFKTCFLIAVPAMVGLMVISGPICEIIKYHPNVSNLLIYGSIALLFMSIMQLQTAILQGLDRVYLATFYALLGLVARFVTTYFLVSIPTINIMGSIIGNIVGYLIPVILSTITINRYLRKKVSLLKFLIKPLIASFVMGIGVFAVHYGAKTVIGFVITGYLQNALATLVAIAVGAFIYAYVLILIGGFTEKDLKSFPASVSRIIPGFMRKAMRG